MKQAFELVDELSKCARYFCSLVCVLSGDFSIALGLVCVGIVLGLNTSSSSMAWYAVDMSGFVFDVVLIMITALVISGVSSIEQKIAFLGVSKIWGRGISPWRYCAIMPNLVEMGRMAREYIKNKLSNRHTKFSL
jgi:hypothetical protein